ncbi:MAG: RNA polymerase-binding protein DksA [Helicobacteraceae bacterium]
MRTRELERFKKILEDQKEQIRKNIEEASNEMESLSGRGIADEIDQASISADSMIDSAISRQQAEAMRNIERALKKIENGTYGQCEMCSEPISLERLKVKPHAKFCIDCREIYEKEKEGK